jgi:hypothetical protein
VQVEPQGGPLSADQARAYAKYLVDDVSRAGNAACQAVRDDQDGINAFILYTCAEKGKPDASPVEVLTTIQSINGRNTLFVQFSPKKK